MVAKYIKWQQNIPKGSKIYHMETKYTKWKQNVPNGNKMYQMETKCTKWKQNVPNGNKIYQMETKYTKWKQYIYTECTNLARPSKIYPNWELWFENTPSGNPGLESITTQELRRMVLGTFPTLWDRCYFKNIFAENSAKIFSFFAQTTASLCKKLIITLAFLEKRQFFRRKLAKIKENCDRNIDPWYAGQLVKNHVAD
jgi:hypothetical protein